MKKVLTMTLVFALALAVTACGVPHQKTDAAVTAYNDLKTEYNGVVSLYNELKASAPDHDFGATGIAGDLKDIADVIAQYEGEIRANLADIDEKAVDEMITTISGHAASLTDVRAKIEAAAAALSAEEKSPTNAVIPPTATDETAETVRRELDLMNGTEMTLATLAISPADQNDWQNVIIPEGSLKASLATTVGLTVRTDMNEYDFKATDDQGNEYEWKNVNLENVTVLTLNYNPQQGTASYEAEVQVIQD